MPYGVLADCVVLVHGAFVVFVVLGGAVVWRWRRAAWLHLPAAAWGIGIEWSGAICPLTPLENWLRTRAGAAGYQGDFIQHVVLPALYPADLGCGVQIVLGTLVLAVNGAAYWWIWTRGRQSVERNGAAGGAGPAGGTL